MKKLIAVLLVLASLLSASFAAEQYDLSGMTYDELVAMKDQINLAMWNSKEWQEVVVPVGTWKIGEDIPAGYWTISAHEECYITVTYSDVMQDNGRDLSWLMPKNAIHETIVGPKNWMYSPSHMRSISIDCKEGFWIQISGGPVMFTPYQGKPSFGFK